MFQKTASFVKGTGKNFKKRETLISAQKRSVKIQPIVRKYAGQFFKKRKNFEYVHANA